MWIECHDKTLISIKILFSQIMGEINAECRSNSPLCKQNCFSSCGKQKWASNNREILPDLHEFLKTIYGLSNWPYWRKNSCRGFFKFILNRLENSFQIDVSNSSCVFWIAVTKSISSSVDVLGKPMDILTVFQLVLKKIIGTWWSF